MSIVNFDRDLRWVSIGPGVTVGDSHPWPGDFAPVVTPLVEDVGYSHSDGSLLSPVQGSSTLSAGVLIVGPDATRGSPYRIKGHAWAGNSALEVCLFIGVASTAPSNTVSTPVVWTQVINCRSRSLDVDEIVNVPSFGTIAGFDLSERELVVGFGVLNAASQDTNVRFVHQLSVQRLAVKPPAYHSAVR